MREPKLFHTSLEKTIIYYPRGLTLAVLLGSPVEMRGGL